MEKSKDKLEFIVSTLNEMFPDAHCELDYNNLFELIIAVSLSAQTTDKRVNVVTKDLFSKYPTPDKLAKADYNEVVEIIKSLGMSKNKGKNIIELSKMLVDNYNSIVPDKMEELVKLPGVGRKTANVILSEGYHIPAIAVDTHVSRVSNLLGLSSSNDVLVIEQDLMNLFDKESWHKMHHLLLFFGRYFCKAKGPSCESCPFKKDICTLYNDK